MHLDGISVRWEVEKREGIFFVRSLRMSALGFVEHAFCGRCSGVRVNRCTSVNISKVEDNKESEEKIWSAIAQTFGLMREQFLKPVQVHGDGIIVWDGEMYPHSKPVGDAIVTRFAGTALCVSTADCVPLLLVDPVEKVIAVVHAGWRGTALNISGKVVDVMKEKFGTAPGNVIVAMGPSIGLCCYEIDTQVYEKLYPWLKEGHVRPSFRAGHTYVDLQGVNRTQLIAKGIPEGNIDEIKLCTSCQSAYFFSYRRDGAQVGRQMSFILLKNT